MPIKQAGFKALRQMKKRAERNKGVLENIKYLIKKSTQLIEKKDQPRAKEFVARTVKAVDKAVQRGILKLNNGSRKKSRIVSKLNKAFK